MLPGVVFCQILFLKRPDYQLIWQNIQFAQIGYGSSGPTVAGFPNVKTAHVRALG